MPTYDFLVFTFLALMTVGIVLLEEWAVAEGFLQVRISRRLVHMVVGLFVVIALITLESPIWLYVSALLGLVVTIVSREKGWIRAINEPGRHTVGTITFPLALLLGLLAFWFESPLERYPLAVAFSVVAVSDPLAAIIGTRLRDHRWLGVGPKDRTLAGSLAFGASAWLIVGLWMTLVGSAELLSFGTEWAWHIAALVSIVATATEMVSRKGWDNLFVILAVVLIVVSVQSEEQVRFLGWCTAAAVAFALAARGLRFLNADGAVLTGLMGGSILFFGGWTWIVTPITFFVFASVVSVWASRRRATVVAQVRGSRRDAVQVLSNGALGLTLVIINYFFPIPGAYWLFAGAFAAAAADTFATEVGTAFKGVTRSIITRKRVDAGASGGVSIAGTIASIIGAFLVAGAASLATGAWSTSHVAMITVAGFVAAIVDSILGATSQVRYMDPFGSVTDAATTKDGEPNELVGGWRFVGNDLVNFFCTLAGAAIVALALVLL